MTLIEPLRQVILFQSSYGNSITETRQRDTAEELIFDEDEADMREWQEEHPNEHRIRDDELPF